MAAKRVPILSAEQLSKVLILMKGADGVELKLSVPDADQRSVIDELDMDPVGAEIRQVAFFDTPDLALDKVGVVVRARRIQGKPADSVVKLRPVEPDALSPTLRKTPGFGVEVDAMPGGFVCSASMKGTADPQLARDVFRGRQPLRKLFSKDQRAFFKSNAPAGIELEDLAVLGPIAILKLKFTPEALGRKMVAELWMYPDGTRLLELSTKCVPGEAFDVAARTKSFLGSHGVDLSSVQQTKTRAALQHFAAILPG